MSGFALEELEGFQREGFAISRRLISKDACAELLTIARRDLETEAGDIEYEAELHYPGAPESLAADGGRTVRRLKQALSRDPMIAGLLTQPELVGRLQQLLGPQIVMPLAHHNCIMTKHGRYSSDTGWHQDIRYWSYQNPELVSVWIALGSETVDNGCLRLIPGTHAMAFEPEQLDDQLFFREDLPRNREIIDAAICAELEAGDTLFFHAKTLHAATRNHTDSVKFSAVFTFRALDNPPLPGSRSSALPELLIC